MDLCSALPENDNYFRYADNFFTSVPLIRKLKARGIDYLGTVRSDRVPVTTIKSEKELSKTGRGSWDYRSSSELGLTLVHWYDNRAVTLLSTYACTQPQAEVEHFDRKSRQRIKVSVWVF